MKIYIALLAAILLLLPLISQHLFACENVLIVIDKKNKSIKCLSSGAKQTKPLKSDIDKEPDFMLGSSLFRF